MGNRYDPNTHEYFIDDFRVPSVTEIIPATDFSFVTPEYLEQCRLDGEENHSKIKMYFDTGDTFNDPYLKRLRTFLEENERKFGKLLIHEKPLFNTEYRFAGRPDAVFENAIIDIKRQPGNSKRHALQLAGYSLLVKDAPTDWYIIWDDGEKFKKRNVYKPEAQEIFLLLIDRYYADQAYQTYMKPIKRNGEREND